MKKYIAVLEIEDDEEIVDAKVTYFYSNNGMTYKATEKMELKEESEDAMNKTYEDGLNEAWELARKIVCLPVDGGKNVEWLEDTFGTARTDYILRNYSAYEAIDAVETYEKLKVGDEVKYIGSVGVVIENYSEDQVMLMWSNGTTAIGIPKKDVTKTGRHFPQIEEVLKQMKEGEDE